MTSLQPLSSGSGLNDSVDSLFELDIPSSPIEEADYHQLIDGNINSATTATPKENTSESGYICASPISSVDTSIVAENSDSSSTDETFFDPENSDTEQRSLSQSIDYYDCDDLKKDESIVTLLQRNNFNGFDSSSTESLPKSQSTTISSYTVNTSDSNNTIGQDLDVVDFCDINAHNASVANGLSADHSVNNGKLYVDCTNGISTNDLIEAIDDVNRALNIETPTNTNNLTDEPLDMKQMLNGHASDNEIEDDEPSPRERFRRCSSLKTGKTPPGTPGRKKIVRFADVLGLDLADVRTFLDEIPRIPKSAYDELRTTHEPEAPVSLGQRFDKIIVPLFQQPGALPHFLDLVQSQYVAMESAAVTDPVCLTISGLVRVRNLDFHKSVHVRYTLDAWVTYSDLQAEYVPSSCDGFSDKFTFTVFGNSMEIGQRIEIALRFSCKGEQFWDNNHGVNYCFQCMPASAPQLHAPPPVAFEQHRQDNHLADAWCGGSFY